MHHGVDTARRLSQSVLGSPAAQEAGRDSMHVCGGGAEDSIEHYSHCDTVKHVMRRYLNLDPYYFSNLHTFTLTNPHIIQAETLTTIALLIYGVYNTTNALRQQLHNDIVFITASHISRQSPLGSNIYYCLQLAACDFR